MLNLLWEQQPASHQDSNQPSQSNVILTWMINLSRGHQPTSCQNSNQLYQTKAMSVWVLNLSWWHQPASHQDIDQLTHKMQHWPTQFTYHKDNNPPLTRTITRPPMKIIVIWMISLSREKLPECSTSHDDINPNNQPLTRKATRRPEP